LPDQKLAVCLATSLAAALSSRSATIEAADEATNKAGRAGAEIATSGTGKSYGLVLKGGNDFGAATGVTGAAAVAALNHARPLGRFKRDTRGVSHSRSDDAHPELSFDRSRFMSTDGMISRRKWLMKSALFTATAGAPPLLTSASSTEGKTSKSVVHYQDHPKQMQMCGMCKFFISGGGSEGGMMGGGMMDGGMMGQGMMAAGACQAVEGRISPMGWCVLYAPRGA
jgi:hypothetical protein